MKNNDKNIITYTADDEYPKCNFCDNCCENDFYCKYCGPEKGWFHYRRTEYLKTKQGE